MYNGKDIKFETTEKPDILIKKLNKLKSAQERNIILVCSGISLMFIGVFVAAFLTDSKGFHEFSKHDWFVMNIFSVTELILIVVIFYFAIKSRKNNTNQQKLDYSIRKSIIETTPLMPGNVVKVYSPCNYSYRIILFSLPNTTAVYFCVEEVTFDYTLNCVFSSEIYESAEDILDELTLLTDITEKVLH
ncbi:MAG: hypothetical protein E7679_00865 [Ruminococcaceae bacterium]|nr:hypothetical protein [Oscillospiraceae bacterium]